MAFSNNRKAASLPSTPPKVPVSATAIFIVTRHEGCPESGTDRDPQRDVVHRRPDACSQCDADTYACRHSQSVTFVHRSAPRPFGRSIATATSILQVSDLPHHQLGEFLRRPGRVQNHYPSRLQPGQLLETLLYASYKLVTDLLD